MIGANTYLPAQVETMVILLGVLVGVIIWGFFQRNPSE